MIAKGGYAIVVLATDLDLTLSGPRQRAKVVQEPTEQPYGVHECAFRDPAGAMIRINPLR